MLFIALVCLYIFLTELKKKQLNLRLDDCQNDLPTLELTSRAGVTNKIDLIETSSKTNAIHFEQDNLLPGKYSGYFIKKKFIKYL